MEHGAVLNGSAGAPPKLPVKAKQLALTSENQEQALVFLSLHCENEVKMIEIDGAKFEGGGQILRTAATLSAVTKKPCRVFNIRQGRPRPGLSLQHLAGLQSLSELCQAELRGAELGSTEIFFYPGEIKSQNLHIKITTAGAVTLCLQCLLLPAFFSQSPVKILFHGGGSDVPFSPTLDYFRFVFLKILEKMGAKVEINIAKRGFYPEGGAELEVKIYPSQFRALKLTQRGGLKKILVISGASAFLKQKKVAERQVAGVKEVLGKLKLPFQELIEYYQTQSPGSQINIIADFENTIVGVDNLGKLGKSAEQVGKEAAEAFLKEGKSNGCLDRHLADQILPYMASAPGQSKTTVSEITEHCRTNVWVIEKFLDGKFAIKDNLITWLPSSSLSKLNGKDR